MFKIDTEVTEESVAPPRRPEASHRPAPQTSRPPKSDGWGWKSWVALAIVAFLFLLIGRRFGPERDVPGETKYLPGKTEYKDTPATLEKLQIAETRRDNLIEQLKEASQKADGAEKAAEDMKASVATETKRADGLQTELNEAMAALKEMAKWGDPEERTDVKPSKAGKVVVEINDPEASGSEQ